MPNDGEQMPKELGLTRYTTNALNWPTMLISLAFCKQAKFVYVTSL